MDALVPGLPVVFQLQAIGQTTRKGRDTDCMQADPQANAEQEGLHNRQPRATAALLAGRGIVRSRRKKGYSGILTLEGHGGGMGEKRNRARVTRVSRKARAGGRVAHSSPDTVVYIPETT